MKHFPKQLFVTRVEPENRDEAGYFNTSESPRDAVVDAEEQGDDRVGVYVLKEVRRAVTTRRLR